jgi:sensor histidine kinase regulating citrate/malate metabolism
MVSIFTADILRQNLSLILVFALIFVVALVLSQLLSRGILHLLKDALHGHRPAELLELYRQQDEVLNAIEEGLVGTDLSGVVVYVNDRARQLLCPETGTPRGERLQTFFPESSCVAVAQTGEAVHNRSLVMRGHPVLVSEIPIRGETGVQGVLSILKDKTEMQKLSDELSGTHHILDTLRFYNHEFMNKLHVILGYLQTGQTQMAMQFIMNSSLVSGQTIRETADCIRVPHLCALLIGKMMHAAENGILLTVSRDSRCREEDLLLPVEDYAAILGNLLENAIEELSREERPVQEIKLSFYCRQDCNIVTCEDTGGGIDPKVLPHIWEKGSSSKGKGRGFGLAIVHQLVEEAGGQVQIETEPGEGTCFTLTFTRERGEACNRPAPAVSARP